jgi:hypothetical protein
MRDGRYIVFAEAGSAGSSVSAGGHSLSGALTTYNVLHECETDEADVRTDRYADLIKQEAMLRARVEKMDLDDRYRSPEDGSSPLMGTPPQQQRESTTRLLRSLNELITNLESGGHDTDPRRP